MLVCSICYFQARHYRYAGNIAFAMDLISGAYYRKVDPKDLYSAAMKGMVESLDPYSDYIEAEDYSQFQKVLEQKFGGIGIIIDGPPRVDRLTIVTPLYGTPAFHAGVEPGDVIVKIDGESIAGLEVEKASAKLKGPEGTEVVLAVEREGKEEPVEFRIKRAAIELESVVGDRREKDARWNFFLESQPDIAYIRITSFGEKTTTEMQKAIATVTPKARGIIIDLRDNPGGLLQSATDICDMFLEEGKIVSTKGRFEQTRSDIDAEPGVLVPNQIPIVLLVNGQSASAAEVVSGCLQDRCRAVVVGERSFGKGSVQNVVPMEGGQSALKLTTARYYPPSGKNIHREADAKPEDVWGVKPNPGMEVPITEEEHKSLYQRWRIRGGGPTSISKENDPNKITDDKQLEKAVETILEELNKGNADK